MILFPTSREEWLALRREDVTASDVGALLGIHPYKTQYELFVEKSGRLPPGDDADDSGAMLRGQLMESVAVEMIRRNNPDWTIQPNIIGSGGAYWRDPDLHIGATPDCRIETEDGNGLIQIKSVEPSIFRKTWCVDERDEITVPAWIAAQVITEMALTGVDVAYVCPIRVGHKVDIDLIRVPWHDGVWTRIVAEATEFWQRIAELRPPPPDYRRDGKLLGQLLSRDDGTTISLAHDNEFQDSIHRRAELKDQIKGLQEELSYHETLMKDRIGLASVATTATHVVTNRRQSRKAYSVAAGEVRVMRVKEL